MLMEMVHSPRKVRGMIVVEVLQVGSVMADGSRPDHLVRLVNELIELRCHDQDSNNLRHTHSGSV